MQKKKPTLQGKIWFQPMSREKVWVEAESN